MSSELIIGIDPGKSGGIAFYYENGPVIEPMPETNHDLLMLFKEMLFAHINPTFAFIENVHSSPQMGVKSAFTFGQGYGALLMLLAARQIPYAPVTPQKWQKALGCLSKGDKNVTKRRAQELFPNLKITHSTADALLIAEYGRRLRSNGG